MEQIIGFYLGYEKCYKFDAMLKFLSLPKQMFDAYKRNYFSRKTSVLSHLDKISLRDLAQMRQQHLLTNLFDWHHVKAVESEIEEWKTKRSRGPESPEQSDGKDSKLGLEWPGDSQNFEPDLDQAASEIELTNWKTEQCRMFLEAKTAILSRVETQIDKIAALHDQLSQRYLKLADLFEKLKKQDILLDLKFKHSKKWDKEYQQLFRSVKNIKVPSVWNLGQKLCKKLSMLQSMNLMQLRAKLRVPFDLLQKSIESLKNRTYESQKTINFNVLTEHKKLLKEKKRVFESNKIRNWSLHPMYPEKSKMTHLTSILKNNKKWKWDLICWEKSSLMRHLEAYHKNSNNDFVFQLEHLKIFEKYIFDIKFMEIKKFFSHSNSLFLNY